MSKKSYKASLRIHSDILTCNDITNILQLNPVQTFNKGEKISSNGKMIRDSSMWVFDSNLREEDTLEKHIENILDSLDKVKENYFKLVDKANCDIFSFYSTSNGQGSIALSNEIIKRLNDYSLELIVDLYLTEEDD